MPLAQRLDVVDPDARVVGLEFQRAFEQELGVFEHAKTHTDVGEQPHAFDVVRHLAKKLSADFLGLEEFALRNKVEYGEQRLRQCLQRFELRRDLAGLLVQPFSAKYLELLPPARNEGGIEAAGARISQQRVIRLAHVPVGMAFFLVSTAVFRRDRLEFRDVLECRVETAGVPAADGGHVERIGIVGLGLEYCGKVGQRVVETLRNDLLLDCTKIRNRTDCLHGLFHH